MYTTANFVDETRECGVIVHGLPEGMEAEEAADRLKSLNLPLCGPRSWVSGYFPKKVYTADDKVFATIDMEITDDLDDIRRNLRLTDLARNYLTQEQPSS